MRKPESIFLLALASSFLLPLLSITAVQSVEELQLESLSRGGGFKFFNVNCKIHQLMSILT